MLDGRTVMITGASGGIGAATARLLAQRGAAVVLMARRAALLDDLAAAITAAGGRALAVPGDVTDTGAVARTVAAAVDTFGGLDAAFNNAGWGSVGAPVHETDDADFRRMMDVNLGGVWNCLRHQIPVMLRGGRGGSIVNTGSTASLFATGAAAPYVAAKHAVAGLTKAAAAEYGGEGIRVNCLAVGGTRTDLMADVMRTVPGFEEAALGRAIQRRLADPAEIAEAVAWLCSDRSSFVTGAVLPVDGGCSAV